MFFTLRSRYMLLRLQPPMLFLPSQRALGVGAGVCCRAHVSPAYFAFARVRRQAEVWRVAEAPCRHSVAMFMVTPVDVMSFPRVARAHPMSGQQTNRRNAMFGARRLRGGGER